jgi:PBP1b-binding outer membrane lipoprotein LpoB
MKKLSLVILIAALLTSCNQYFTPERAANTGGKTCRDRHIIR